MLTAQPRKLGSTGSLHPRTALEFREAEPEYRIMCKSTECMNTEFCKRKYFGQVDEMGYGGRTKTVFIDMFFYKCPLESC